MTSLNYRRPKVKATRNTPRPTVFALGLRDDHRTLLKSYTGPTSRIDIIEDAQWWEREYAQQQARYQVVEHKADGHRRVQPFDSLAAADLAARLIADPDLYLDTLADTLAAESALVDAMGDGLCGHELAYAVANPLPVLAPIAGGAPLGLIPSAVAEQIARNEG